MLSKIWKDPVWSKVIASCIIGATLLLYAALQERNKAIPFADTFSSILKSEIRVSNILICLSVFYIGKWTLGTIAKERITKEPSIYNKKQQQVRKFNKIEDKELQVAYRWEIYFDMAGKPFISDLDAFCLNHGETPIRFMDGRCPQIGCENHRKSFSEHIAKNHIESMILNEWDKLNS